MEETSRAKDFIQHQMDHISNLSENVSMPERHVSLAAGGAMAAFATTGRQPLMSAALGLGALFLLMRGFTGHCYMYESMGINSCEHGGACHLDDPREQSTGRDSNDIVDEASEESMVASDAPAHTPTTGAGQ